MIIIRNPKHYNMGKIIDLLVHNVHFTFTVFEDVMTRSRKKLLVCGSDISYVHHWEVSVYPHIYHFELDIIYIFNWKKT